MQQNELQNSTAPTFPGTICHLGIAMEATSDFSAWRERAMACINATANPLKDQYSSNYYRPDRSSSPYNAVRLAMEAVSETLCRPDLRDSPDWKSLSVNAGEKGSHRAGAKGSHSVVGMGEMRRGADRPPFAFSATDFPWWSGDNDLAGVGIDDVRWCG
jgi:hypothetical protein